MANPEPFNTKENISNRGMITFETIESRLMLLNPPILIKEYIVQEKYTLKDKYTGKDKLLGKPNYSSLETHNDPLDGINFRTDKPDQLTNALNKAKDIHGKKAFASMKEDPDHWALKASFGVTKGIGWRETWRPKPYSNDALLQTNPLMDMRFGTAGIPIMYTALHCAVDKRTGKCNIHIDENGFIIELENGVSVTPDLFQHTFNELFLKSMIRDWLSGKISDKALSGFISEAIRRVSIVFPNATNGYAGLDRTINSFQRPTDLIGGVTGGFLGIAKIMQPIGLSIDLIDNQSYKLQFNYTKINGEKSHTLTIGKKF